MNSKLCTALLSVFSLMAPIEAQWSADPSVNQAIAAETHTEDQPKIVATSDGGFFVSYYASDPAGMPAFGFDVRLQRLDATGAPLFSPAVLVADRGFSSTQDYGLAVNANNEAFVIFRDDRPGGTQITAAKVDGTGALVWGALGVQLTATTAFVASPRIAATPDGGAICAWGQDADTRVQKLDSTGTPVWGPDLVLSDGSANVSLSDMHPDGAGGALISCILSTTFSAPRHLELRRASSAGMEMWRTSVFDGGSLQLGNFPDFVPDGSGGAAMAWYSSSPALECYGQHIASDGSESFPHNGVSASTNGALLRVSPSVVYAAATSELAIFYTETSGSQSMDGVSGQKFDATGNRLWGAGGTTLQAMSLTSLTGVSAVGTANEICVAWVDGPSFGNDQIFAAQVDGADATVVGPMSIASQTSVKFRLGGALGCIGYGGFVWRDERAGNPDIYVQNLGDGGVLGPIGNPGVVTRNGSGVNPNVFAQTSPAVIGTPWTATVGLGGAPFSAILISQGGPNPGLPTMIGELLCNGPFLAPNVSTGSHSMGLPLTCALVGRTFCMQAVQVTITPSSVQLTNALDVTIGAF